jgi:hypothetical protein
VSKWEAHRQTTGETVGDAETLYQHLKIKRVSHHGTINDELKPDNVISSSSVDII